MGIALRHEITDARFVCYVYAGVHGMMMKPLQQSLSQQLMTDVHHSCAICHLACYLRSAQACMAANGNCCLQADAFAVHEQGSNALKLLQA